MVIGTFFTLFIVPSIYMLVARSHVTVAVEKERTAAARQHVAEAVS